MKKQNLIFGTVSVLAASLLLVGCGNQKSTSANVDNVPKVTNVVKSHKKESANKIKKQPTKKVIETKNTPESTVQESKPAENTTNASVSKTTSSAKITAQNNQNSQVDADTLGLDFAAQQKLVNIGMGYVAQKEGLADMPSGYWNFAKSTWGISDAQVLVKTSENTFQIFGQGAEQYTLTIDDQVAVLKARSNYTQTTKTVTINLSNFQIVDSTF